MKYILQAFFALLLLQSCQSDELKISFKTIEINIQGTLGPAIKNHSKYYCYFEKDNPFDDSTIVNFYILDENGKILANIPPPPIQFSDYNLTVRNDSVFTNSYKKYDSFYLDEKKKKWIRNSNTLDIIFKDQNYTVFNESSGDCCYNTWFRDNTTGKKYSVLTKNAVVNKLKNAYYLTSPDTVLKIKDPKKLGDSVKNVNNNPNPGIEILYKDEFPNLFKFSLATSFVVKQNLYHVYSEYGTTKIAVLKDNNWNDVFEIKDEIRPFQPHYFKTGYPDFAGYQDDFGFYRSYYAKMNYFPGNEYQTIRFSTGDPNRSGIIEIDKNKLNLITFKNKYREPILGEPYTKSWVEKNFMDFYHHFNTLSLQQIDRIEQKENALNLSQYAVCNDFFREPGSCELCRSCEPCKEIPKIYEKIERKYIHLVTTYFHAPDNKSLKLIEFRWKKQSTASITSKEDFDTLTSLKTGKIFIAKFDWLYTFLKQKLGEPTSEKTNKTQWETENQTVELAYMESGITLTLYKKTKIINFLFPENKRK